MLMWHSLISVGLVLFLEVLFLVVLLFVSVAEMLSYSLKQ